MDTFDGLIGGTIRERKLEIMRDSRLGSFGALAGICVLLLKFSFLAGLDTHLLPVALLMVLPVSRWAVVLPFMPFPVRVRPSWGCFSTDGDAPTSGDCWCTGARGSFSLWSYHGRHYLAWWWRICLAYWDMDHE